jgi:uncharacterized SAM-binding protein YcdF (DUF218 family)
LTATPVRTISKPKNRRSVTRGRAARRSVHTWLRRTWLRRAIIAAVILSVAIVGWAVLARRFAPQSNTARNSFDAIIVLGYAADADGNPTPVQLARVAEAVQEYERGVAPRLIVTGGAVANHYVEAQTMARTAEAQGVPASAVFIEPNARDTIQNACYSVRLMKAHGWSSAEVVSSPSHLPRAGLIFSRLPVEWRAHSAPPLEPLTTSDHRAGAAVETLKTIRYLLWTRWYETCTP